MDQTVDGDEVSLQKEAGEEPSNVGQKSDSSRLESCLDQPMGSGSVHEDIKYTPSTLPAKHYDPDTTEPISCGLQTLEELLSWKRSEANPFNVAVVPLAPRDPPLSSSQRRTLVSHDMMGGYLDDRFAQGTNADAPYAFYHWPYIDIFNYFTHNLVTIPPAVWTNAAHRHGVIVLGTFITEWTEGAVMCEAFLKDEESYRAVADKLVQISHCYGFDGWLINIENALSETAVKNMPLLLRYLTDQMHERVSGSLVLWYDSVIQSGQLTWQNELNQHNRMFFDACDGFFTNYNWTEQNLEWMADYSEIQGRKADVYIGVDVFARGKVVGGMLETNKALEVIRKHNFSAAIFAPGWVYETHQDKTEFRKNQDKFWALLADYLYIHRPASPLPFISSFCQGFGKAMYRKGQLEANRGWFNLTAQEIQPLYYNMKLDGRGWLCSRGCPDDAWNGGCSLLLDGLIPVTQTSPVSVRIFSLHVPLAPKTLVTLIYKPSTGIRVSLELQTTEASLCTHMNVQDVKLAPSASPVVQDDATSSASPVVQDDAAPSASPLVQDDAAPSASTLVQDDAAPSASPLVQDDATPSASPLVQDDATPSASPLVQDDALQVVSHFSQLCGNLDPDGWTVGCSQLELRGCALREVCLKIQRTGEPQDTPFTCRVGEIMLLDDAGLQAPPQLVKGLCIYDVVWLRGAGSSTDSASTCLHLNATLQWDYPIELVRHFRVYWRQLRGPDPRVPPGQLVLVGRAYSNIFRVTELAVPEAPGLLEVVVEPVIRKGFLLPESHWGRRSLSYSKEVTE